MRFAELTEGQKFTSTEYPGQILIKKGNYRASTMQGEQVPFAPFDTVEEFNYIEVKP